MIAIDLDGTLLSPRSEVTQRTKDAVHRALKAGLLVCFATGRNWTESRTVVEAVEHYASAVFAGGAMVVDTERDVTLHRMMMDPALAAELSGHFEADGPRRAGAAGHGRRGRRLPRHRRRAAERSDAAVDEDHAREGADGAATGRRTTTPTRSASGSWRPARTCGAAPRTLDVKFAGRIVHQGLYVPAVRRGGAGGVRPGGEQVAGHSARRPPPRHRARGDHRDRRRRERPADDRARGPGRGDGQREARDPGGRQSG